MLCRRNATFLAKHLMCIRDEVSWVAQSSDQMDSKIQFDETVELESWRSALGKRSIAHRATIEAYLMNLRHSELQ